MIGTSPVASTGIAVSVGAATSSGARACADGCDLADTAEARVITPVQDSLTLSDPLSGYVNHVLSELAAFSDAPDAVRSRRGLALDGLRLADTLMRRVLAAAVDGTQLSDDYSLRLTALLGDLARTSDQPLRRLFLATATSVLLSDSFIRQLPAALEELTSMSDTPHPKLSLTLLESVELSELFDGLRRVLETVSDGAELSDSFIARRTLFAALSDSPVFMGVLQLDDAVYNAWVVNTHTLGPVRYTNYPFNSIAGGYAARSDGIYKLEGEDDAGTPIDAWIETGLLDFKTALKKQVPDVYIAQTSDGQMVLKVTTSHDGSMTEDWYALTAVYTGPQNARFQVGKGLRARYWKFRLENIDGSNFDLSDMEARAVALTRRL